MPEQLYVEKYNSIFELGVIAAREHDFERAFYRFNGAAELAKESADPLLAINSLQPAARSLWSLGKFEQASSTLNTAKEIAIEHDFRGEEGIVESNMGRLEAVRIIRRTAFSRRTEELASEAVPHFLAAFTILRSHPHLYYRYANAQHGSVVAAVSEQRPVARALISEGMSVAFRSSAEPYDQIPTYRINPAGLGQIAAARALLPFADKTPILANQAFTKLIR